VIQEEKMRGLYVLLMVGALVALPRDEVKSSIDQTDHHKLMKGSNISLPELSIGLIVPHTSFSVREYTRAINRAVVNLRKSRAKGQSKFSFLDKYQFTPSQVNLTMMKLTPSPTGKYFRDWLSSEENVFILLLDIEININILWYLNQFLPEIYIR